MNNLTHEAYSPELSFLPESTKFFSDQHGGGAPKYDRALAHTVIAGRAFVHHLECSRTFAGICARNFPATVRVSAEASHDRRILDRGAGCDDGIQCVAQGFCDGFRAHCAAWSVKGAYQ
jgi:hypothetical protein